MDSNAIEWKKGRVVHIEPRADGSGLFIAGDLLKTRVWFKKSVEDNSEHVTEIAKIDGPPDNLLIAEDELIMANNIPGIIRKTVISRINKQTLEVSSRKENFWVLDWQMMSDGTVRATRMNGLSAYSSSWENHRTIWKHSDKSTYITYWYDKDHGVATN